MSKKLFNMLELHEEYITILQNIMNKRYPDDSPNVYAFYFEDLGNKVVVIVSDGYSDSGYYEIRLNYSEVENAIK